MAVGDSTILVVLLCALNYALIWNKGYVGKLIGDLMFLVIGISTYLIVSTDFPWGILIAIIAGIHLMWTVAAPEGGVYG